MTIAIAVRRLAVGAALLSSFAVAAPALAQETPPAAPETAPAPTQTQPPADAPPPAANGGGMDILSRDTISVMVDIRLAVANGHTSFVNGGFGKTRFQGDSSGGYAATVAPEEADIVWNPRFSNSLSANVSAAWQNGHDNSQMDLMEAFLNYLPAQTGPVGFSGRLGYMWPEISLEHSTGGAWSVVNTITPSAINSWVGEEVKVLGAEGTVRASLGEHDFSATGGVFGWNDTSGTLLSFRGWALQDIKGTAFGSFKLPPLNSFITQVQQDKTDNTIEVDRRAGFYGRIDWHPPYPFTTALFYYDNEGDPEAFTNQLQWGWRTRFWNLDFSADVAPQTRLLVQGMTGSTIMGFPQNGVSGQPWVHTDFSSAYALLVHDFGKFALTGRIESFGTQEHGSEMMPDNSENGWAWTLAARIPIDNHFTTFVEALNVRSERGTRVDLGGLSAPFESQMVFQVALRAKLL